MFENEPGGYPPEAFTLRAASELAFGRIPFDDDIEKAGEFVPEEEMQYLVDFKLRRKTGYDAIRGCGYEASQARCTLNYGDENGDIVADMVAVDWIDGFTAVVDLLDLHTEQSTEGSVPELEVRSRILSAMMQLTDL